MLRALPGSAADAFVHHVEYAAKFPQLSGHLQLASADMDLVTYLCLDVIALLVASVLVSFTVLFFMLRFLRSRLFNVTSVVHNKKVQ